MTEPLTSDTVSSVTDDIAKVSRRQRSATSLDLIAKKVRQMGGEDWLFGSIETGSSMDDMAGLLGFSRDLVRKWLHSTPELTQRFIDARKSRADSLVEENLHEAANGDVSFGERSRVRQWTASKWDKETYGDSPLVVNNINHNTMHLTAIASAIPERPKDLEVQTLLPGQVK